MTILVRNMERQCCKPEAANGDNNECLLEITPWKGSREEGSRCYSESLEAFLFI